MPVPAVIALYHSLASVDKVKAATGCGMFAVVIPVIAVLLIVHGRLVYRCVRYHRRISLRNRAHSDPRVRGFLRCMVRGRGLEALQNALAVRGS